MCKERVAKMTDLYKSGYTLQQIGDEYGITRERVRQILSREGVCRTQGGSHVRSVVSAIYKHKERKNADGRYVLTYGCTKEVAESLNGGERVSTKGTPAYKYAAQRKNAHTRGIEWDITFPEWLAIWKKSGHFDERGRAKGYCMARYGDSGPYHPDNVEIITIGQNFSDSYIVHPWHERFAGVDRAKKEFCIRGHKRTPENLTKSGNCKECNRIRKQHRDQIKHLTGSAAVYSGNSSDSP